MPHRRSPFRSALAAGIALLLAAALAGCEPSEKIKEYKVTKPEELARKYFPDGPAPQNGQSAARSAAPTAGADRMVAGILPRGSQLWFFKFAGPTEAVVRHSEEFIQFLLSIRFAEALDSPPTWTLPEGWKQEPGSGMRYATLKIDDPDKQLEATVTKLAKPAAEDEEATIMSNVNRWRGQMGMEPIDKEQLAAKTKTMELAGGRMTLVVLSGKQQTGGMAGAPFAGGAAIPGHGDAPFVHPPINEPPAAEPPTSEPPAAEESPALTFDTPKGWQKGPTGTMRLAAFAASDGSRKVEITVIALPPVAAASDLLANVNRWRGQVNLPDTTAAALAKEAKKIPIGGVQGDYVELVGPKQTILCVMAAAGDQIWFVKLSGDPELAQREKAKFESFVKSIKFSAH